MANTENTEISSDNAKVESTSEPHGEKRPAEDNGVVLNVKRRKGEVNINLSEKNPISILNELRLGLKYNLIEQKGPSHAPIFKVSVDVDGHTYIGVGGSKKIAKCKAAEQALKSFIQFPNDGNTISVIPTGKTNQDFTSDAFENEGKKTSPNMFKKAIMKGPVMLLNELYPNATYDCVDNEGDLYARYKTIIHVNDEKFVGTGSSKKLARNAAATVALTKLVNYNQNTVTPTNRNVPPEEQEKADNIGSSCVS